MVLVVLDNQIQKSNTPTIQQLNTHFSARVTESVGGSLAGLADSFLSLWATVSSSKSSYKFFFKIVLKKDPNDNLIPPSLHILNQVIRLLLEAKNCRQNQLICFHNNSSSSRSKLLCGLNSKGVNSPLAQYSISNAPNWRQAVR